MRMMLLKRVSSLFAVAMLLIMGCITMFQAASHESNMKLESHRLFTQITQKLEKNLAGTDDGLRHEKIKNIFSMLVFGDGTQLYAIEPDTMTVIGTTSGKILPSNFLTELKSKLDSQETLVPTVSFYKMLFGEIDFCMAEYTENLIFFRTCNMGPAFSGLISITWKILLCLLLIMAFITVEIDRYINKKIVHGIDEINRKLVEITAGRMDQSVAVSTTPEFVELSSYINRMVESILAFTDKMSYILDQAQVPMGVYEYNATMSKVSFTKQVPHILHMSPQEELLLINGKLFEKRIEQLKQNAVKEFENIYQIPAEQEYYIRIEQLKKDNNVMGILIDVTEDVQRSNILKKQRDIDILTGFYNRRALDNELDVLFEHPEKLGHSALFMIDSDGLKQINDRYGHDFGDRYLRATADALKTVQPPKSVFSRQGGDEFVLFFYGCETQEELEGYISRLMAVRDHTTLLLPDGTDFKIAFSLGYTLCYGKGKDYSILIREADQKMYAEKKERKAKRLKEENNGSQTI